MVAAIKGMKTGGSVIVRSHEDNPGAQRVDVYRELDAGTISVDEAHEKLVRLEERGRVRLKDILYRAIG